VKLRVLWLSSVRDCFRMLGVVPEEAIAPEGLRPRPLPFYSGTVQMQQSRRKGPLRFLSLVGYVHERFNV
jgi:hypothetical protein